MDSLRHLPALTTLRAFEAVGRHLSFSRAANELFLTQSAVSHQVQKLERDLGGPLFVRRTRSIAFTPRGQAYHEQVRAALEMLDRATRQARDADAAAAQLKIGLLASFAARWLVPRLAAFTQAHPGIGLQLVPDIRLADVAAGEVDLAIRYGRGHWNDVHLVKLMAERVAPVCAPALLGRRRRFKSAAEVARHPLLVSHSRQPFEWELWSQAQGMDLSAARRVHLHDYNIVIEAALAGQGIAMGRQRLVQPLLDAGRLVMPAGKDYYQDGDIGWWLAVPRSALPAPAAAFCQWIQAQAAV
ncbi:transcriptional regulator GcvA [Bordetella petrii]|uniref:transcriptional regulator GcvA n=1 Tax=Bordetella petrii TaxID=94624 RepID=UPI001E3F6AEC|nr:transcriptional regulator GcvA [Bordetella petrii]MCD0504816.1 transcriptional regulator GcvA [Bordetella petrii]